MYEQCGKDGIECQEGECFKQNDYYSQCLESCPEGWACQSKKFFL